VFSPVAMKRLSVVVLDRDARPSLRALGRMGVMHLVKTTAGPETAPLPPVDRTKEIAHAESLLARIEALREGLGLSEFTTGGALSGAEISISYAQDVLHTIETRGNELLSHRQDIEQQLAGVGDLLSRVEAFQSLDIPLDWIGESPFMHFAIGRLPAGNLETVRAGLAPNVILVPMPERGGHVPMVAITTHSGGANLDAFLKDAGFAAEPIPAKEGATTASLSADSREEEDWLRQELEQVSLQIKAEAERSGPQLQDLWRQVTVERQLFDAEQHFPRTEQTALLTGWVPAPDVAAVQQGLGDVTGGRFVLTVTDPGDVPEDDIPVLLRYPAFLRPFASLVTGYGLPRYRELSPTPLFAVTFVVMFGMMFGDAGNGAVLLVPALYLLFRGKTQAMRDAGLLVLLMGLSAVGFGIVFGSYFGFQWFKPFWDVEENPAELMAVAIYLGIGMMSVGILLNIFNRLRHGQWLAGIMDKFGVAGAIFYWGALAVYLNIAGIDALGTVAIAAIILAPLALIALKEPLHVILSRRSGHGAHGSLGEACIESLIEAFDAALGYLSNTVSFVRLAAYSIAHAAVLKAAIGVAHGMGDDPAGLAVGVLIIVLGNAIAIALEGVVATVQAVRLEYYEFFGKFFSGAGKPFAPFRIDQEQRTRG
jgi:V/A-type H+/Na+-transporting ATPase subunit I